MFDLFDVYLAKFNHKMVKFDICIYFCGIIYL